MFILMILAALDGGSINGEFGIPCISGPKFKGADSGVQLLL